MVISIVKDRKSTGWDSNPRRRITGAESLPLDDQCLLLIHQIVEVGSEGLEPSPVRLRAGCAAANTSIPYYLFSFSVGPDGVEPSSCPYKEPALTIELRAVGRAFAQ